MKGKISEQPLIKVSINSIFRVNWAFHREKFILGKKLSPAPFSILKQLLATPIPMTITFSGKIFSLYQPYNSCRAKIHIIFLLHHSWFYRDDIILPVFPIFLWTFSTSWFSRDEDHYWRVRRDPMVWGKEETNRFLCWKCKSVAGL